MDRDGNRNGRLRDPELKIEGPLHIRLYTALPLREASRLWGHLNALTVPQALRPILYGAYARAFGCNLDEMEVEDLQAYPNLGEFFYRRLKSGARVVDGSAELVSPSDGKILSVGRITPDNQIPQQIKGVTYSLEALLGRNPAPGSSALAISNPELSNKTKALHFCVIYLAPGDYHRFHSPTNWNVAYRRHFSGELLSVSPWIVEKIRNLFILNERVALTGTWKHGFFSMIPVGATNVGSIRINFDPDLETNIPITSPSSHPLGTFIERAYPNKGVKLLKGDEVGGFRLGSTVVLVFEAPETFEFGVVPGQQVLMGQKLGFLPPPPPRRRSSSWFSFY